MPNPIIHFVAGMPRSGSTLLMNLLAQNPQFHVTPTNGLINMMSSIWDTWTKFDAFQAQGLQHIEHRIAASLRAMSYGFYEEELSRGQVVFDKSRGWLQHIELLEKVYKRPVRVICTVRDIKAVAASFEKLHRANPVARRAYLGPSYIAACDTTIQGIPDEVHRQTDHRREGQGAVLSGRRGWNRPPGSPAPHDLGCRRTERGRAGRAARRGCFGGGPPGLGSAPRPRGWGPDLHTIRSKVEPPVAAPWEGILPPHTCQFLDQEFRDIQQLVYSSPLAEAPQLTRQEPPPPEGS